jgi:hypothetical protein
MQAINYTEPNSGKANRQKRIDFWKQVIKEQERSDLKASEFCKVNNIVCRKLQDWKYRLKKLGLLDNRTHRKPKLETELIPIELESHANINLQSEDKAMDLEIKLLGNSYRCKFQYSEQLLESIIRVFRKVC